MAFYKMSKVTSYQLLVIGRAFEHRMTILKTTKFLYKYSFIKTWDIHQLHFFSVLEKTLVLGQITGIVGEMVSGQAGACPQRQGLACSYTGHRASSDTTRLQKGISHQSESPESAHAGHMEIVTYIQGSCFLQRQPEFRC